MTYQQTVEWMFLQLPMYQKQGATAYKADLSNTLLLASHLGNPEKELRFVHVAGTNGKGSSSHMIASILQQAGYKTGLYTSPHLKDFRERIRINGLEITEAFVTSFIAENKPFFEAQQLSFFEMSVGLAFAYFKQQQVDIAVIETGLGGRLDATNIIRPLVSVITNIGIDHTQFLGTTLKAIAAEKAGIIKQGVPVVIGEYEADTRAVFIETAQRCDAPIYFASDTIAETYPSDLKGNYQQSNKKTVLQTIRVLQQQHFDIPETAIEDGFANVVRNTGLQGRWQQLGTQPTVICDTAHNRHGLSVVLQQVLQQPYRSLHIVFGVVNDKDLQQILPLFPVDARYYFAKPDIARGLDASVLQQQAKQYGLQGQVYSSVPEAYRQARLQAAADDFIYIGGSTFVVAEIL